MVTTTEPQKPIVCERFLAYDIRDNFTHTQKSQLAEGPRDALCQLKLANCCTTVRKIPFQNTRNI